MSDVKSGKKPERVASGVLTASVFMAKCVLAYACCRLEQCMHGCDCCVLDVLTAPRPVWTFKMIICSRLAVGYASLSLLPL